MERIKFTKRGLVKNTMGVIYEMAPFNKPRYVDKILDRVIEYADEKIGKKYLIYLSFSELKQFVKDMLMPCQEFQWLNISQAKWNKGQRELEEGFSVCAVAHGDDGVPCAVSISPDYYDFIDLDACIGNIACAIRNDCEIDCDCFLCKYAKEYQSCEPSDCEECRGCICNPDYKCNHEPHPASLLTRNSKEYEEFMTKMEENKLTCTEQ